jgi:polyisoprenoid-binding protein YceI
MKYTSLLFALIAFAIAAPASAADYTLDKAHTDAEFIVTHLALSKVHGQIPLISGTADIGPNGMPNAINATFDLAKIATDNDRRDGDLRDNYFEVAKYPVMTFVETAAKGKPDAFTMTGNLTIHGVTKPVTIQWKLDGTAVLRGKRHFAYSGTTSVDRRDFGMTFGPLLDGALIAGYDVTINLETDAIEN